MKNIIVETDRLKLRELTTDDAPFFLQLVNTDGWLQNIGDRKVYTLNDAEIYLKDRVLKSYEVNQFGMWGMELKGSNELIGMCGLVKRSQLKEIDIGFALLPAYYRRGYTLESAKVVMNYAKNTLKILNVVAICNTDNKASLSLLQKLGLTIDKKIKLNGDTDVFYLA
jgi:RimJ/RimL family protein N-acetyltransferase